LCKIFIFHKVSGPTDTPVSLVIRAYGDEMASATGNT